MFPTCFHSLLVFLSGAVHATACLRCVKEVSANAVCSITAPSGALSCTYEMIPLCVIVTKAREPTCATARKDDLLPRIRILRLTMLPTQTSVSIEAKVEGWGGEG